MMERDWNDDEEADFDDLDGDLSSDSVNGTDDLLDKDDEDWEKELGADDWEEDWDEQDEDDFA